MATTPTSEPTVRAPRRVVLLAGDEQSEAAEVLHEYSGTQVGASRIHADLVRAGGLYQRLHALELSAAAT